MNGEAKIASNNRASIPNGGSPVAALGQRSALLTPALHGGLSDLAGDPRTLVQRVVDALDAHQAKKRREGTNEKTNQS